ncbi:MAG: P-loop NTPase [Sandarakinorhabdus sp.]|nr:P-loop NTPase [Sandarakinorhabdus sp.]
MNVALPLSSLHAPGQHEAPRLHGITAYVQDGESEAVLHRLAAHLALPGFQVRRGTIATAERDLKTQRSPAMLFVDVTGVDRVLDAVRSLSDVCEPQLQLVVIGQSNDVGLFRGLLGLGVADYLFKPLTAELLESVVWRLTSGGPRGNAGRLGKLVAVTGARGGAGASSVAANLATYLAEKASRRVALVDLDVRTGALALMLGAKPNSGLAESLEVPGRIDDLFLERATISIGPRLDLLASEMPAGRPQVMTIEAGEALLGRLQRSYHYVIIDVPMPLLDACRPWLASANVQLLVTEGSLLGVRDAVQRLDAAAALSQRHILIHNKAGRPGDLPAADFATALGRPAACEIPFLPRAFGTAINLGRPVWQEDRRAETAVALVSRELSGQPVSAERASAWRPAWRRMLGLAT